MMGWIKCKMTPPPPSPLPPLSVCPSVSGSLSFPRCSALLEEGEEPAVPVGESLGPSDRLAGRRRLGGVGGAPLVLVLVHQLLVDHPVHVVLRTHRHRIRGQQGAELNGRSTHRWSVDDGERGNDATVGGATALILIGCNMWGRLVSESRPGPD